MKARDGYAATAEYLAIDRTTLRGMVHRKTIPHIRISDRVVVFDRAAIDGWIAERAVTPAAPAAPATVTPVARSGR